MSTFYIKAKFILKQILRPNTTTSENRFSLPSVTTDIHRQVEMDSPPHQISDLTPTYLGENICYHGAILSPKNVIGIWCGKPYGYTKPFYFNGIHDEIPPE
jgi:hypothetical protein